MPGGDSGPDGEEPALLLATQGHGEERVPSGQLEGGAQSEHLRGEECGGSGGEVGQEDEEMTSGSHDLSSSANHSPGSTIGSTSVSTKRYLPFHTLDSTCPDFLTYVDVRSQHTIALTLRIMTSYSNCAKC